jgi:hypothetical protein
MAEAINSSENDSDSDADADVGANNVPNADKEPMASNVEEAIKAIKFYSRGQEVQE